ncbi:hypothetical protein ANO11243_068270 [Dothideomycetidae sp. 11243]|nr:hypothetical protein ANO11243_068270 [fungal sp. No.11243]
MRFATLATVIAVAGQAAWAFEDTSVFFLFSSSRLADTTTSLKPADNIATALKVKEHVLSVLQDCPSDVYLVINQPGISARDFADEASTPHLRRRLSGTDGSLQTRIILDSVVGDVGATGLVAQLSKHCKADVIALTEQRLAASDAFLPQIITIDLPEPSSEWPRRPEELGKHGIYNFAFEACIKLTPADAYINAVISSLPTKKYTVIFRSTPVDAQQYQQSNGESRQQQLYDMDDEFPSSVHANHFKRDVTAYPRAANGSNLDSNLPLFEKYQFLSPGMRMQKRVRIQCVSS